MPRHKVFEIAATIENGFDLVDAGGVTFMRVIALGRVTAAVPQTAPELRQFAASLLNAADRLDQWTGGADR